MACKGGSRRCGATLDQVRGAPGFAEAVAGFRRFHGGEPTMALVVEYDDGRPGIREEVLYAIRPEGGGKPLIHVGEWIER